MAKETPKLKFEFEKMRPASRTVKGDFLRVQGTRVMFSPDTFERMGYPETVGVEVSKGGEAIRLTVPGDFRLTGPTRTEKTRRINSRALVKRLGPDTLYLHVSDNLFVREGVDLG